MELVSTEESFERVTKKRKLSFLKSQEMIDRVCNEINRALPSMLSNSEYAVRIDHKSIISELRAKLQVVASENNISELQRDVDLNIRRHQKNIEKDLNPEISKACRIADFDLRVVDQIITAHLCREGLFHVADCFLKEAGETEAITALRLQFEEFHQILDAVKHRNLEPAQIWISRNQGKIKESGSNIELQLHKLKFVEILQNGNRLDAIKYARTYLAPLSTRHMKEIQRLLCSSLWAKKLEKSSYADLTAAIHWENLVQELVRVFYSLLGQPLRDPLKVSLSAGFESLPTLLKLEKVMAVNKQEWQRMKQLPVPLELGNEFQFHSAFVCPISRDQASEDNPPMLLPCGHVLCKKTVDTLSKKNSRNFKCPYCPVSASFAMCKHLHV